MAFPTVSVVVLNFNGREMLAPCLESLRALDYDPERLEIVVCDNGSEDGSVEYLRAEQPQVRVLELERNFGFAEGNDRAAAFATGELVAFLNNDMRVDPGWIRELVAALERHPGARCVSSKILNWDGTLIDFAGAGINFQGFGYQFGAGLAASPFDHERRIMCPCGGSMLIDRRLFLDLGGFDPDYFAFYEDTDLGWRLNLLGHDVWYVPDAIVYHHHHGTAARLADHQRRFLYERNALFTMFKCLDDENLAAALPASLILLNEKSLELARFDRDSVRPDLPPVPPPPSLPPLRARIELAWQERGVGGVASHTGLFLSRRFQRAWAPVGAWWTDNVAERFFPPEPAEPPLDPLEPIAVEVAIGEFARSLPRLREKRTWIQARRVRSDQELLPLFHFALEPSYFEGAYPDFHRELVKNLGLEQRFAAGHLHRPPPPSAGPGQGEEDGREQRQAAPEREDATRDQPR